jgi:plastocyanin
MSTPRSAAVALAALVLAPALLLAAPVRAEPPDPADPADPAQEVIVIVGHAKLDPASVTVRPGVFVTFYNQDAMPGGHTIAAEDGSFESPPLRQYQRWSHRFTERGTYRYRIVQHPDTKGEVVVE